MLPALSCFCTKKLLRLTRQNQHLRIPHAFRVPCRKVIQLCPDVHPCCAAVSFMSSTQTCRTGQQFHYVLSLVPDDYVVRASADNDLMACLGHRRADSSALGYSSLTAFYPGAAPASSEDIFHSTPCADIFWGAFLASLTDSHLQPCIALC